MAFSNFRNNRKQPSPPPPNSFGPTDVYCICDRARSIRLAHCNQIQCFAWLTAFLCAVRTSQINTVLRQKPHLTCGQVAWVSQSSSQGRNCVFQKILRIEAWQRRKCLTQRLKNSTHIQYCSPLWPPSLSLYTPSGSFPIVIPIALWDNPKY